MMLHAPSMFLRARILASHLTHLGALVGAMLAYCTLRRPTAHPSIRA